MLLLSRLPPPYGGLTVHAARLKATLERLGWCVVVRYPPPPRDPAPRTFRRTRLVGDQLRFLWDLLREPCTLIHDHISTYAIGHSTIAATAIYVAMLAVLRVRRRPWILSCGNGLLPGQLAEMRPELRAIFRFLYRGVGRGIAKNGPILDAFRALGLGERSRVIGTFLEPGPRPGAGVLAPDVERFFAAHPSCVVTAGFRFEPLYNLDAVVRAVAEVRHAGASLGHDTSGQGVGLVILGSKLEDPKGKPALDAALRETGLGPHALILRDVDNALDIVARAAVFVRATDVDGDANTVKEAMMVDVPVLATDLPGRPPGLDLIPRMELASLGTRLCEVLAGRDAGRIERNRAFVADDIARNTRDILRVYEEACGG